LKKMLTMFVAVVMVLTMATPTFAASFTDTAGKNCETAVEVLSSLGIVEGKAAGTYEPDSSLTRAEMATIILRTMNMAQAAEGKDIFSDVPSSHWAYANITAAYQLGIVNGTSATTFEPDKVVTYEQAVKMVVAALGYSVQAEALGGYPSGYLAKASQLNLLKGVEQGGDMKRGNMALLVYNALDTNLFMQTGYGDVSYEETEKTLLSYYLKAEKKAKALVEATYAASAVSPAPSLLSDEVRIDGVTMKAGETDAQNMLGMRADVYYREDELSGKPIVLAIVPRATIEVEDIAVQNIESLDGKTLSYTDADGKQKEADLSGATVVYNGRKAELKEDYVKPGMGTVRLISDGGEYTHIIVEEYKNYVVNSTNTETSTVYFKSGDPEEIDPTDKNKAIFFTDANGQPITVAELAEWDVLSIAKSEDGEVLHVYRSNKLVEGKITELSEKTVPPTVTIDGTVYSLDSSLVGKLTVGKTAAFYLDYAGAVAALNENYQAGSGTYGWLVAAANTKGLNGKPQLKIFTQDGEMKVFDTVETVQLDGTATKFDSLLTPSKEKSELWLRGEEPSLMVVGDEDKVEVVPQLIKFEVNEEGLITSIDTAQNTSNPSEKDNYAAKYEGNEFSLDWYWGTDRDHVAEFNGTKAGTNVRSDRVDATNSGKVFFSHVTAYKDTIFFSIPADPSREEEYEIINLKSLTRDQIIKYTCLTFYDVNEEYYCGAMVLRNDLSGAAATGGYLIDEVPVALILGSSITLSEDGVAQNTMKLYTSSGSIVKVVVEDGMEATYYNTASDITKDPDWYTYKEEMVDGKKEQVKVEGSDVDRTKVDFHKRNVNPMHILVSDLVPGDVIQYETDSYGLLTSANVVFRTDYAKVNEDFGGVEGNDILGFEMHTRNDTPQLRATNPLSNYYNTGKVMMNGVVKRTTQNGALIDVVALKTDGTMQNVTYERLIPNKGTFVLWDSKKEEYRAIALADIREDDIVFSYWASLNQRLVVVYRD